MLSSVSPVGLPPNQPGWLFTGPQGPQLRSLRECGLHVEVKQRGSYITLKLDQRGTGGQHETEQMALLDKWYIVHNPSDGPLGQGLSLTLELWAPGPLQRLLSDQLEGLSTGPQPCEQGLPTYRAAQGQPHYGD